jgi:hypothetical protein
MKPHVTVAMYIARLRWGGHVIRMKGNDIPESVKKAKFTP